jgi:Spy/CpxP family protein refolding chaperone
MRKSIVIAGAVLLGTLATGAFAQEQAPEPQGFGAGGPTVRRQERVEVRTFGPQGERGRGDFAREGGEERMAGRLLAALDNDRVKAFLNLTDQQVDRLRQILVDAEKSGVKTRADIAVRGIELRELLRADKPDHDAVMTKVQELSSLRGQVMKAHIEALLAAKSVLTPEQQKKVRSFIENRAAFGAGRERMGTGREGMGFGPRRRETAPRPLEPPARPGEPPVQ